ncbi:hypothetical protein M5K25_006835 [Dendrobium thyrsiflorum]|uniref:Uncharacterized protein n=1 Tax=Dendrobium thyrsiflorum TaxID=117978 RepID=A0ABD0VJE6_DENTH
MSDGDTIPLHPSSQSDIDEIENLIYDSVQSGQTTVLPARPPSPPRASIPVSSSPFINSNIPPPSYQKATASAPSKQPVPAVLPVSSADFSAPSGGDARQGISSDAFGSPANTLTEPVWDTVKRDLSRIVNNLKLVVFPNPYREDPGKALRDWDLWGPFFFIVFLGLALSWSASVKKQNDLYWKKLRLTKDLSFRRVDGLKYLGVKISMKKLVKAEFSKLIQNAKAKVHAWGYRHLSLIVLTEIERTGQNFLWDKGNSERGLHYASWKQVCKPRKAGGLGFHATSYWVSPLRARLTWGVIHNRNSLGSRCLIPKYGAFAMGT